MCMRLIEKSSMTLLIFIFNSRSHVLKMHLPVLRSGQLRYVLDIL